MKKLLALCGFLLLGVFCANAQNPYYYYKGEKINLKLSKNRVNITTTIGFQETSVQNLGISDFELTTNNATGQNTLFGTIEFASELENETYQQKTALLKANPQIIAVSPHFVTGDTTTIGTSSLFYVKLKQESDSVLLRQYATQKNIRIVQQNYFMPLWYRLSTTAATTGTSLDMANFFYETGAFAAADPAFIFDFRPNCTNDTNFDSLWGLYNAGNPDIDINACQAWELAMGAGVNVAVLDYGIDKTHLDLAANISSLSYDTQSGTSPSVFIPGYMHGHGTHVAGTIGAVRNNERDIVGVAPKASIISISHPLSGQLEQYANGFSWALLYNVDVINNSWGCQGNVHSELLEDAITNAITNGRNGKGMIVVFASGNDAPGPPFPDSLSFDSEPNENNNGYVDYPANFHPDILCVGAIDRDGQRAMFEDCSSSYGSELDIVAPGKNILSTIPTNSTVSMDGTSMAAPHVSGIAALMLSVNPDLTGQQVRDIIESTAQKTGCYSYALEQDRPNGTWHEEVGYGLVDAYAAVLAALPCYNNENVVHGLISSDTTWNGLVYVSEHIIVPEGVTLSITDTVRVNPYKSIIVQQGGKLIIDGGTLTSACDGQMWQGIEVWGTRTQSQLPLPNSNQQYQGELILKNGAIIENALCAVALWRPDHYSTTGGILNARDAAFRNNAKSIHALHYINTNPNTGDELPYQGIVRNCTFEINEKYPATVQFHKHVDLSHVWGFNFTACDFSVDRTIDSVSYYASGIAAYSAGFSVYGQCTDNTVIPCQSYKYSTFEGFYYGIYAAGSSNRNVNVLHSEFTDNLHGIYLKNSGLSNIKFNEFQIPKGYIGGCPDASGFGIRMENSSGYNVVDNDFSKYGTSSTGDYYGIAILVPDPPTSEEIYRNSFSNLKYANYVKGESTNAVKLDPNAGVLYQCNSNTGNYADFFSPDGSTRSFCPSQGSAALAAGNTFSPNATWHFHNGSNTLVNYYYATGQKPASTKIKNVTLHSAPANNCNAGGGAIDKSADRDSLTAVYNDALENYNNVNTLYESLKDGGSTTQLQVEIQTAQPNDMWEIRAELLGISPHLSDTVLLEVADKTTVFSEAAIFDIMAANPDELKNLDLLTYLEQKENPLPEYMINILHQVAGGTTYKTALLEQMASYNHEKSRAANAMIRSFVEDTISTKNDSIRAWYAKLGGLESDKRIIASYLEENDFETALTLAESMPETYNFDETQQIEHERYVDILELHQTLFDENRYMDQLDENELAMLETFAQQSQGTSGSIARGILTHFYDQHFDSCPCTDEDNSLKSGAISPTDFAKIYGMRVETHPNPANTWIAFDYRLPENAAKATLTITDLQGRVVTTIELTGQQGQHLFDTRQLTAGTYLYSLQANDKQVNGKFAVAR